MKRTRGAVALFVAALAALVMLPGASGRTAAGGLAPSTQFYAPGFEQGAKQQWAKLVSAGDSTDAALLAAMENTPRAVWLTGGSPNDARVDAVTTVLKAEAKRQVPVLVLYNVPFRDCGQYSAGGALDTAAYEAWIDGVARGIGDHQVVIVLEPDGLGIIPYNTDINGNAEWCRPDLTGTGLTPATANAARYAQLRYAVTTLGADPNAGVYLDATHPAWLGVGDIADRLVNADVADAAGFFLNASNHQFTTNAVKYGTWISQCIAQGSFGGCANQYWNGGPDGTMIASLLGPWTGVALSPYGEWSDTSTDPSLNTSGYAARFWGTPATHFLVDTSRNGLGPWKPTAPYPDAQDWCNPPGRGLGLRPTADTGVPLVDAYLWIKTPGESDGQCNRGISGSTTDPEWGGIVDPAAGDWFPQQALQLAQLANPPLLP
jgi:endoglucanase